MNAYQNESAVPPVSEYAKKVAENNRRYQEMKAACAGPHGAGLTLGGLALGILTVEMTLLYPTGLSILLLVSGFEAILLGLYRERAGRQSRWLGALLLLSAAGYLLHYTPSTRWICSLGLCLGLALQLAALDGPEPPLSAGALLSVPARLLGGPIANLGLPFAALGSLRSTKSKTVRTGAAILLGLALALPVSGVLLILFASADAIFNAAIESFFSCLQISPALVFCDATLGSLLGLLLAARLLAARFSPAAPPAAEKVLTLRIPALVSGAFLWSICMVTLLFVGFQFAYLFGGEETRAAWEMTYSDYARRGFFELCAASAVIFAAALCALLFTRPGKRGLPCGVRLPVILLCLGDFVILISALWRMLLYVCAYGMSVKRLLALWGMAVVATGLILLLIRCINSRFHLLRALLAAGFAAICILSLANTERLVAGWNVRQMSAGNIPFDSGVFQELSYTAAPQLEKLYGLFPEKQPELDAVFAQMHRQYECRHPLYSFSLDQPGVKKVFSRHMIF